MLKDFIREQVIRKGYSSLYNFCRKNNIDYHKLWGVLHFLITSRPLIFKVAELLDAPELVAMYEKELQARKAQKTKSHKGGVP